MHATYALDMTMRAARDRYFEANGFGPDGGYDVPWVDFTIGSVPLPFPNTPGRVKAVKFHDLHHVLTGYETNPTGEFQISAWEIGGGCGAFPAAWVINSGGLAAGLVAAPRKTFAAFVRGRRSRTLYGERFEPLLDERVGDLRSRFVSTDERPASAREAAAFVFAAVTGIVVGLAFMAVVVPLMPIGLIATWMKKRRSVTPQQT